MTSCKSCSVDVTPSSGFGVLCLLFFRRLLFLSIYFLLLAETRLDRISRLCQIDEDDVTVSLSGRPRNPGRDQSIRPEHSGPSIFVTGPFIYSPTNAFVPKLVPLSVPNCSTCITGDAQFLPSRPEVNATANLVGSRDATAVNLIDS